AEAVNTACYVLNRALVIKSYNKTPYELLHCRTPRLDFMRPFGCPVTILNTLDPLGKFEGNADEGFLVSAGRPSSPPPDAFIPAHTLLHVDQDDSQIPDLEDTAILRDGTQKVAQALNDESWIEAMQEELLQFSLQKVWRLVDLPYRKKAIGTKWVHRNKKDERGIVVRNKARLVAQGHRQEEGIDYDKVFAPVARIDAIKIFLAFTSFMGFIVYQMDVKSAFLYGTTEEEVYVSQPPGFIDPQFPNKVYKTLKNHPASMYELYKSHTAFNSISSNLVGFSRFHYLHLIPPMSLEAEYVATVDRLPYIELYSSFFHYKSYFYASNIEQFWNFATSQTINDEKQIRAIVDGKTVVILESLVRRDLFFNDANRITCLTNDHIFENLLLMGTITPLFATMLAQPTMVEGEGSGNPPESQPIPSPAQPINESQIPKSSSSPQNTQSSRQTLEGTSFPHTKRPTFPDLRDSSDITKTQSKATLNEPTPRGEVSGSGLGRQETMGGYIVRSGEDMMEHDIELTDLVPQIPYDSSLSGGHTPGSDKGSMTLKELTDLCTTLLQKVFDLENVKIAQAKEIARLKKRITKLEQRQNLRFLGFHPFRAGASKRNSLGRRKVSKQGRKNLKSQQMFHDNVLDKDADTEMIVEDKGNREKGDVTIADTLVKIKNQKAKEKGIAFKDTNDSTRSIRSITTLQPLPTIDPKDKGKGILQESKPVKKSKKIDQVQIERDTKVALKSQVDLNKEARTERERQEETSKAALAEMYDEVGSEEDEKRIGSRNKREAGSGSKHKSTKKQKVNDQDSKDSDKEHRKCLKVVPDDDKVIDYETLDVKSLIVDCESQVLGTNKAVSINMLVKKKYPLTKEILEKMLSSRLETKTESTLALCMIKFIKLQIEE
nr:retrovirus-related Pol polyprotein from transposon TNT 1-94 [Tanacetum cinerariifolium]